MNDFRPRLPAGIRFAPTSGGVAFLTREGVVRMNGASVHLWVERLAGHLDGSRTVAELTAELPDERRAFVTSLLTTLRERGLVEDAGERGVLPVAAGATCSLLADADRFGELAPALADAMRRLGLEVLREPSGGALVHVAAADADGLAAAGRLDRLSAERGLPIGHVLLREGEAWWSETGVVGRDVPPWAAGWRRLAAMEAVPPTPGHVSVSPVAAAVVAGQVVADLGRYLSGTPRVSGGPRLHVVDLDGFGTRTHSFLPHLSALPPGTGASAGALGEEEFSRRAARLMDSRTGVFAEIEEGEYGQLPLHVSVTTVADPMGTLGGARARVIGVGADFAAARYRAALKALTVHGLLALDPRRLVTAEGTPLTGVEERPDDGLLDGLSDGLLGGPLVRDVAAGRVEAFVRGRDLVEGGEVLLPARAVFLDPHATGAAAGYSAEEALVAALLDHCAALAGFDGPLPPVDVGGARAADGETARSAALLDAIGLPYRVLDATGPSGVPVYAGTLGGRLVARAAGVTPLAALRATLEGILAAYQGIPNPAPLPDLCPAVAQEPPVVLDPEAAGLGAGELAAALAGPGLRVSAVPLDHDREVHALMPHVVRVVTEPLHG